MLSRREFMQMAAVTAGIYGTTSNWNRAAAQQAMTQEDLLKFNSKGQVTLLHITDMHAQLKPLYFRPPSENYGVGDFEGRPPHLVGEDFLRILTLPPERRLPMPIRWLITRIWRKPMAGLAGLIAPQPW
jgi:sulfur-oxidizing protein SoxB